MKQMKVWLYHSHVAVAWQLPLLSFSFLHRRMFTMDNGAYSLHVTDHEYGSPAGGKGGVSIIKKQL
jgi:hypothetical protein